MAVDFIFLGVAAAVAYGLWQLVSYKKGSDYPNILNPSDDLKYDPVVNKPTEANSGSNFINPINLRPNGAPRPPPIILPDSSQYAPSIPAYVPPIVDPTTAATTTGDTAQTVPSFKPWDPNNHAGPVNLGLRGPAVRKSTVKVPPQRGANNSLLGNYVISHRTIIN